VAHIDIPGKNASGEGPQHVVGVLVLTGSSQPRDWSRYLQTKTSLRTGPANLNDTRQEVYNAQAADDAWKRVTSLFRENL
jgi:hypothetical protein